jgi:hypothetical protein
MMMRVDERIDLERLLRWNRNDFDVVEHVLPVGILVCVALCKRVGQLALAWEQTH